MADISINSLNKYYGDKHILKNISFDILNGEKVAIVGANGAGKTTLFNILAKGLDYDSGQVFLASKNIGVIDQIPIFNPEWTVLDVLNSAFAKQTKLIQDLEGISVELSQNSSDENLVKKYGELSHKLEAIGGYSFEFKIDIVCNGLQIDNDMRNKKFNILSGGEKTRVNLARIILGQSDILLLDEPTNHLDMSSVIWLGNYMKSYKGTVLIISHDRYFIDEICSRIIEIEDGVCDFYDGAYTYYINEKNVRNERKLMEINKAEDEKKRLEEMSRTMHQWGTEKMHKRAFSIDKKLEKIHIEEKPKAIKKMKIHFNTSEYHTEEILKIKNLSKNFGDKKILDNIELTVRNSEKIAIIGDNGSGKSTLLKLILKELSADTGSITQASGVKSAYLPQMVTFENIERNLIDTLIYSQNLTPQTARNRLGAFHFSGDTQLKTVKVLSGGEKSRLKLCQMLYDDINLLILDEPTNHLDILSREWIEEAVEGFDGTLIFVSHDRYFINRFATRIIELKDGGFTDFKGTYNEFCISVEKNKQAQKCEQNQDKKPIEKQAKKAQQAKNTLKKINVLEREISSIEQAIIRLDETMITHASDANKLLEIMEEKSNQEELLNSKMEQWALLNLE